MYAQLNVRHCRCRRGGVLYCRLNGKRTLISGKAALYAEAEITTA